MNPVRIIDANVSHASLLTKLALETFCEAFAKDNNPDDFNAYINEAFHPDQIKKEITEPGSRYILAFADDEAVGYARLRESDKVGKTFPGKKTIELQRIYSLQKYIGKGVGKALMDYCLELARKSGGEILWLGVWEHNHRAQRFYKKLGFEAFGSHVFMLGTDAQTDILMKLNLR